jgi:hypothetical protein
VDDLVMALMQRVKVTGMLDMLVAGVGVAEAVEV